MSKREEIDAACEIVTGHSSRVRLQPADVLLPAMRMLAEWTIAERAERQRRIEAAADTIKDGIFGNCRCGGCMFRRDTIRDIITRCLNGEAA